LDIFLNIVFLQEQLLQILLSVNTQGSTFLSVLLLILLVFTFIISGSEVAMFSLNVKDVNLLKTKQHSAAKKIISLLEEKKELYTSFLLANTFFNICIIILANFLMSPFLTLGKVHFLITIDLDFLVKVIVIVFVLVFVGKILPKIWASQNNIRFAYGAVYVIEPLFLLLRNVSTRLISLADTIGQQLGADRSQAAGIEELNQAIDISTDEEEKNILKGIVKFGDITVKQIMKSRMDVSGIEYNTRFSDLINRIEKLHYSRLPVFKGNMDEVAGIINTKDLLPFLDQNDDYDWHSLIRAPFFVPESKFIKDLLREFQSKRMHFAFVVDEFGGTSGIVTMEDVLEEIIGEIRDEFDEDETDFKKLDDYNFVFEGKTMLHDVCRAIDIPQHTFDEIKGESDSLAGLILEICGVIPKVDDVINSGDFNFTILEADKSRIQKVKLTILL
jgi:putative hemolysin